MKGLKLPALEHIKKLDLTNSKALNSFELSKFLNKFVCVSNLSLRGVQL